MTIVNMEDKLFDDKVEIYKADRLAELARWGEHDRLPRRVADYLQTNGIDTVVLGVSGGVDSALALAVLMEVKKRHIPGLNIFAESMEFNCYRRVFDRKMLDLVDVWATEHLVCFGRSNLSGAANLLFHSMRIDPSQQTEAQATYAMRYLALFALAQDRGGVVVGTTNFDELGYAGWFGKHSDMNVDIQFLSQYHKFEIRALAEKLGVPPQVIHRDPVGDLIDGSTDEDNFGCTYDQLSYITGNHGSISLAYIKERFPKLWELRQKNAHKYATKKLRDWNPVFI